MRLVCPQGVLRQPRDAAERAEAIRARAEMAAAWGRAQVALAALRVDLAPDSYGARRVVALRTEPAGWVALDVLADIIAEKTPAWPCEPAEVRALAEQAALMARAAGLEVIDDPAPAEDPEPRPT